MLSIVFPIFILFAVTIPTISLNFQLFRLPNTVSRDKLKADILSVARKVERGAKETPEEREKILKLFTELEKQNPNKNSLSSPLLNAVWNLEYTTSKTILGQSTGGKPVGKILQIINVPKLYAENSEVIRYFGFLDIPRKVTAKLSPLTKSKTAVAFQVFSIGPISFRAPATNKGELDITYLDEDLRLSRGDKGNIFILSKVSSI
jgi:hypothetical protein